MLRPRLALITLATIVIGLVPLTARADNSPEARFASLINAERTRRGLTPLVRRPELDRIAERHSERMRRNGDVYHNSNLGNEIPGSWTRGGENVGVGFDVDGLHAAFMASPDHRANILSAPFDEIGLGVVIDGSGEVFATEVFVDRDGSAKKKSPPASSEASTKKTKMKPAKSASSRPGSRAPEPKPKPSSRRESHESRSTSGRPSSEASTTGGGPAEDERSEGKQSPPADPSRAVELLLRIVSIP